MERLLSHHNCPSPLDGTSRLPPHSPFTLNTKKMQPSNHHPSFPLIQGESELWWDGHLFISSTGEHWGVGHFSFYVRGNGDVMVTSLFYLKEDGDMLASCPFSRKGNGGGGHFVSSWRRIVMGGPPLHSTWRGKVNGMGWQPFYLKVTGTYDDMVTSPF